MIIGIDPGMKGGIAFISLHNFTVIEIFPMLDRFALSELLKKHRGEIKRCFVEKQHPYPKQGAVSSGKLMKHYGEIIGILTALEIPFEEIPPQRWQSYIHGSKHKKKPRKEKKKASIMKARQLFPGVEIEGDGEAEALLIAEYGRRLIGG